MFEKLKDHLVEEWREFHKLWSVQLNSIGLALLAGAEFARDGVEHIPPSLVHLVPYAQWLAAGFFVLGILARGIRQKKRKR